MRRASLSDPVPPKFPGTLLHLRQDDGCAVLVLSHLLRERHERGFGGVHSDAEWQVCGQLDEWPRQDDQTY